MEAAGRSFLTTASSSTPPLKPSSICCFLQFGCSADAKSRPCPSLCARRLLAVGRSSSRSGSALGTVV